ncbi:UNVERIFIED_CONTAM: hypothetical protein GTU68_026396 [Idotea baltica]|nr:hypothetical protein [Idotea baltica]
MFYPVKTKYKKQQKMRNKGVSSRGCTLVFGKIGLKAVSHGLITSRQLEAGRKIISKSIKKEGQLWIRIFPDKPITAKPTEVRMGKGKGNVNYWGFRIKTGRIIYEINFPCLIIAKKCLLAASYKLPVKTICLL